MSVSKPDEGCKCVYKLFVSFSPDLPEILAANKLKMKKA